MFTTTKLSMVNEEKLKRIAAYLFEKGYTSDDEDEMLEQYEDNLTIEEIGKVCRYLADMRKEEPEC